jgi:hypothetical protein
VPYVHSVTRQADRQRQTSGRVRISIQPNPVLLWTRARSECQHPQSQMRLHQNRHGPRRNYHNTTIVGTTHHAHSRCWSHHVSRWIQEYGILSTLRTRTSIDCGEHGHSNDIEYNSHALGPEVRSDHREQRGQTINVDGDRGSGISRARATRIYGNAVRAGPTPNLNITPHVQSDRDVTPTVTSMAETPEPFE